MNACDIYRKCIKLFYFYLIIDRSLQSVTYNLCNIILKFLATQLTVINYTIVKLKWVRIYAKMCVFTLVHNRIVKISSPHTV